jgi:hypothetical protein
VQPARTLPALRQMPSRRHPAAVRDDVAPLRPAFSQEGDAALRELIQALAAARAMKAQIRAPGVDGLDGDLPPGPSIPVAKVQLAQPVVDVVAPAPGRQALAHGATALQRRGPHLARARFTPDPLADAMRQAPGAARVDGQVGAPEAQALCALRPRVAPQAQAQIHRRLATRAR